MSDLPKEKIPTPEEELALLQEQAEQARKRAAELEKQKAPPNE